MEARRVVLEVVQLRADDAVGVIAATPGDLEVDASRVMLSLIATDEGRNDLMPHDIVTRRQLGRDRHVPDRAIGERLVGRRAGFVGDLLALGSQLVRGPEAEIVGVPADGDQTDFLDLEPLQVLFLRFVAWTVAISQIVDDRPTVVEPPAIPHDVDHATGLDGGLLGSGVGVLLADDIGGLVLRLEDRIQVTGAVDVGPESDVVLVVWTIWWFLQGIGIAVHVNIGLRSWPSGQPWRRLTFSHHR